MQTLKTAAIVVLMMAVIYGAYVSMTKPPETLPEDVQGLLAVDEGLDIPFDSTLVYLNLSVAVASPVTTLVHLSLTPSLSNRPTRSWGKPKQYRHSQRFVSSWGGTCNKPSRVRRAVLFP